MTDKTNYIMIMACLWRENMSEVYSDEFVDRLYLLGCKAVICVEFVPVTEESVYLAPGESDHDFMLEQVKRLQNGKRKMVFITFQGDEKNTGGCVAAGLIR